MNIFICVRYFAVPVRSNYSDAIKICNDYYGVLSTITSVNENYEAILACQGNIPDNATKGCWTGLNSRSNNWEYIDGTNVKNTLGFDGNGKPTRGSYPWTSMWNGQPDNANGIERCVNVQLNVEFEWNDAKCFEDERIPLCMKNPAKSCGININDLKVWYKGGLNDISNNGYDAINIDGMINDDDNDCSVYGDINTSFVIPYNINTTSDVTIYVAQYNGNITIYNSSVWSDKISSDGINIFGDATSNWKMYELMIFESILSHSQTQCIEQYLFQEHFILEASSNYSSTCPNITTTFYDKYTFQRCYTYNNDNTSITRENITFNDCKMLCSHNQGISCIGFEFTDVGDITDASHIATCM